MLFLLFGILNKATVETPSIFADDSTVFSRGNNKLETCQALSKGLDSAQDWAVTCGMLLNAGKSEWLQITSKHTAAQDDNRVTMKGQAIPRVKVHNHLVGLKVTSTLSWSEHISRTRAKCAQRVGMIRKIRHLLPNHVLKRIYVAQVRSVQLVDSTKKLRLVKDASDCAVADVLLQEDGSGDWHPIAYTSRRLNSAEQNYHATERETLAVIHSHQTWRIYFYKPFDIVTDNRAVTYLRTKKDLTTREARWIDLLADFDFSITHRPGREQTRSLDVLI